MWTEEEVEFLKKNYPDKGKMWCCEKLGKSEGAVRYKAHKLGLSLNKKSSFFIDFQKRAAASKVGKRRPEHSKLMKEKYDAGLLKMPLTIKHGLSGTKVYSTWSAMLARCYNPSHRSYVFYGGRDIAVCKEWHDVSLFKRWYDANFKEGLTIDRIDVDGDYEPLNCRFATIKQQARNKRGLVLDEEKVVIIRDLHKKDVSQRDIAKLMGVCHKVINQVVLDKTWVL